MKVVIATMAFLMLADAQAQQVFQPQPAPQVAAPKKRTVVFDERTNELVEVQVQPQQQAASESNSGAGVTAPIYIMNNQKVGTQQGTQAQQAAVQEAPTSVVQEAPLKVSPADQMRKRRVEAETNTEDTIVQTLEKARIEDEVKRRDRFNSAIAPVEQTQQAAQAASQTAVVNAPYGGSTVIQQTSGQTQVQGAKTVVVKDEENDDDLVIEKPAKKEKVDIRSEIRAAIQESTPKKEEAAPSMYIGGLLGMGKYPDVVNIRGDISGGFAVGIVTPERIVAEGYFLYGRYQLEDVYYSYQNWYGGHMPRIVDMKQYNAGGAVKYQLLPGKLRPNVGGALAYNRRAYSENGYEFRTSDAVDAGLLAGVDLQLTNTLSVGFDFRYMMNIGYRHNTSYPQSFVNAYQRNEIEKLDYYTATLAAKLQF